MSRDFTRRDFVKRTALAGGTLAAATFVPRHVLGGPRQIPPSEKMNVAGVGIGGMGRGNLRNAEAENIVALCDVDPNYSAATVKQYPKAKFYLDYREMLDKEQLDGALVGTRCSLHATMAAKVLAFMP